MLVMMPVTLAYNQVDGVINVASCLEAVLQSHITFYWRICRAACYFEALLKNPLSPSEEASLTRRQIPLRLNNITRLKPLDQQNRPLHQLQRRYAPLLPQPV